MTGRPKYPLMVHIEIGGPEFLMNVGRESISFEIHRYFGPVRLNKKTGSQHVEDFPEAFWPLFERWRNGGERCDISRVCIVPPPLPACKACDGTGYETEHMGGRNYLVIGPCETCKGTKVQP